MFDSLIKHLWKPLGRHQADTGDVTVYATFKAKTDGVQPQAGTPPEIASAPTGMVTLSRATGAIESEGPMSVPETNRSRDSQVGIDAPEFGVQPHSIGAPESHAGRARPGSVGMYDYDHPAHPVNRTHQPDRLAQLQRGTHARAVARDTRTRRSR